MNEQERTKIIDQMTDQEREFFLNMSPSEQEMFISMTQRVSSEKNAMQETEQEITVDAIVEDIDSMQLMHDAINALKSGDQGKKLPNNEDISTQEAAAYIKVLLPDGTDKSLYESDTCLFCNDTPQPKDCYAILDMGHQEPVSQKRSVIGLRVKTKIGSIAPLQIACCKTCKNNYRKLYWLGILVPILFVALVLVLLLIPPIYNALGGVMSIVPLLIFVLSLPAGWFLGQLVTKKFKQSKSKQTNFNVLDISYINKMTERGWFPISATSKGDVQLIFSNELRNYSLLPLEVSEKSKKDS